MLARQTVVSLGISTIYPMLVTEGFETICPRPDVASGSGWLGNEYGIHDLHLFYVLSAMGMAGVFASLFTRRTEIATGLLLGALASIGDAYFHGWEQLGHLIRFISLLLCLGLLLTVTYARYGASPLTQEEWRR